MTSEKKEISFCSIPVDFRRPYSASFRLEAPSWRGVNYRCDGIGMVQIPLNEQQLVDKRQ